MMACIENTSENSMADAGALSLVSMAVVIVEDEEGVDQSSQLASFLRFPISDMDSSTSSSLPPLDQVSDCSEGDDDSSLSSDSFADERESPEKSRRSIFNQYWEKVGGAPSLRRELDPLALFAGEIIESANKPTDKAYERALKEGDSKMPASDNSRRRNIFNKTCWSQSLPALTSSSDSPERKLRKIQSSSVLQRRKPKQSCLRQGRFSSEQLPLDESESSSSSSVHFSPHADVKVFTPPVEIWASGGWSSWFS
jgi:hypothetical protein